MLHERLKYQSRYEQKAFQRREESENTIKDMNARLHLHTKFYMK